jgi:hypothetical protein|tara:strand:+ start:93 stop:1592 length:1500 start_codon:yes stop_codon:yes gene_type:complete
MKIPTYTSTARITSETPSVTSNIQIDPRQNIGAALQPIGKAAEDYYIREKAIETKVKAGELNADATVEIFNAAEQAELKSTPQDGIDYFTQQYEIIKNKYKSQASNKNVANTFDILLSQNKNVYVNNILKKTRDSLVTTRVGQVEQQVSSEILNAVSSGNKFQFDVLSKSALNKYKGLVDDGIISEENYNAYKKQFPSLVEIAQVRSLAQNNSAGAAVLLSDPKNFPQITGDVRQKLITEVRKKAVFDGKLLEYTNSETINKASKKLVDKLRGTNHNKFFGLSPQELETFKTGDQNYDKQITELNDKINLNQFSFDSNYNTNSSIVNKINLGEIKNTKDGFLLEGEKEPKSIMERAGDGSVNDNDLNFLTTITSRSFNNTFANQDKEYLKWFDNLTPLLQGNVFLSYFDKEYNSKASNLRQVYYKRYIDGLRAGIDISDLLSPNSTNYIAKDIKNVLPKTSDLSSIVTTIAEESSVKELPERLPNETASEYDARTLGIK